jgi:hypothetical protein
MDVMKYLGRIVAVSGILFVFVVVFIFFTSVEAVANRAEKRLELVG